MLHMQNPYLPASGANGGAFDWSKEISGTKPCPSGTGQQTKQVTNIQVTQQNTNQAAPPVQATPPSQITPPPQVTPPSQVPPPSQGTPPVQVTPPSQDMPPVQTIPSSQVTPPQAVPPQTTPSMSPGSQPGFPMMDTPRGIIPTLRPQGPAAVLDLRHHLPEEVVQSPTTVDEAHMGSMKAVLGRNLGNFVVATFLVGTQGTTSWEGLLYEVGNDYLIIYQTGRDRYVVCDIYSLKYIEFYDTRRQGMCESLIRDQGWQTNSWQDTN